MKSTLFKTLALSSVMLVSANAHALSIDYNLISSIGISYDDTKLVDGITTNADATLFKPSSEFDHMSFSGNSFTLTPPSNGASFTDYGFLTQTDSYVSIDTSGVATVTEYTFSATFEDWTGTYNNVIDAENFEANFDAGGTVNWSLTKSVQVGAGPVITELPVDVMTMAIAEGNGYSIDGVGSTEILFEITDVYQPGLIYLDADGDGYQEDEDLQTLLANLDPEDEGFYLTYINSTNTIIPNATEENVTYSDELIPLLNNLGIDPTDPNVILSSFVASNEGGLYFATVPEPATLGMMSLALFGLAGFQRRRKNNS